MTDNKYIKRTIQLARKGIGNVNPNPMVGSVIVKSGEIVGEGYHRCFGEEHAEIIALRDAGEKACGATLYVNLEPCCHYGKTSPCTDAIIKAGIKQVVIGMVDPNPLVNQRGIEILKQHNIEVIVGIEEQACKELNRVFIKFITTGMPYVTLKIAQSLDGRIASMTGNSQWITSHQARVEAHRIRRESDAIIVGIGTVLADNPQLTVRHVKGRNPIRIVLDSHLRIPLGGQLLTDKNVHKTIVATTSKDHTKISQIKKTGAHVWEIPENEKGNIFIPILLKKLANARMSAIMVEGGAQVFTSFLKERMVDHIVMALAPKIIGTGIEAIGDLGILNVNNSIGLINVKTRKLGPDLLFSADVSYNSG
ncbi:MAG: bifunctional diaminohydroxyphosphoribosylaminopyrimidine deaminase/5-amino-6-(5-phosphoribosylamino)uracil reductase RibD [bacterium]|nr:MAG: bifunctional diaminohydroxyphosphoribosylaminopyrimidine deaminase/5-amino-6-(5-phosphoribosylamino)uracil reductase RibD [bacterium]